MFPFANGLVKLSELTIRDKKHQVEKPQEPAVLAALDERFLDNPGFAVQLCKNAANEMAELCKQSILLALQVVSRFDASKTDQVIALEQKVDHYQDVLGSYMVKLAGRDLNKDDSHLLTEMLHSISDFERISDHAINLTEAAGKMHDKGMTLTDQGQRELDSLSTAVRDIIRLTTTVFQTNDVKKAADVEPLEQVIDGLVHEMMQRHIVRLRKGICSMEAGLILEDIVNDCERVSDHCSNIAVTEIEVPADVLDMHEYLGTKVRNVDPHFIAEYNRLKDIYILP